jgi:cytochrome bd-type quinol oxidase subunit 1
MIQLYKNHWPRVLSAFLVLLVASFIFAPGAFALEGSERDAMKEEVRYTYDKLNERVNLMEASDPKKDGAKDLLDTAKDLLDEIDTDEEDDEVFLGQIEAAQKAINDVNLYLIKPVAPGATKITGEGTVPEGDIIEDFIPQFIRLLFRFASLAVLIAFVVSGIMFVVAFDNEERVTKAKQMLYYSIIGFAFVTLAFAIVKAITDIDFFGFI